MRILTLILAACLAGCVGKRDITVTPLPRHRVEVADYTIGESSVCGLHHVQMNRTAVPIAYGLLVFDVRYRAKYVASTNLFPHADTFVLGGCYVSADSPKRAAIYTCPECKIAAAKWDSAW
jgi:hypothetical protein